MKTIEICGKEYPIDCNALTYKNYRSKFNTDIFSDIRTLQAFLTKQVLLAESLKKDNPNVEDSSIISSLSTLMLEDMGLFIEAATRMAYIMILAADKKIPEYDEWLESIPTIRTNDEWIAEVTEFAVNCFC